MAPLIQLNGIMFFNAYTCLYIFIYLYIDRIIAIQPVYQIEVSC